MPGARNRYLAPILPLVALLIGLAAQQCCAADASAWLVRLRRHFFIGMGLVAAGLGVWVVVATALQPGTFARPAAGGICDGLCPGGPGCDGDVPFGPRPGRSHGGSGWAS